MKKGLNILCASTNRFPIRHSFLEEVLCRGLTGRGHRVTWMLQTDDLHPGFEQKTWLGCKVWLMPSRPHSSIANRLCNFLRKPIDLTRILQRIIELEGAPDVIQVRNDWLVACWALIVRRRYKSLVVFQYSFPIPQEHFEHARTARGLPALLHVIRGYLEWASLKFVMQHADHILPISNSMKTSLIQSGIDPGKMTPFPLGITIEQKKRNVRGNDARNALGLRLTEPVVIYFGSLSKFRNLDFLLETMKMVVKNLPSARLIILGGTRAEVDSLQEKSNQLGLGKTVIFREKVSREEVPYFINAANAGVSPIPPIPMYVNSYPTKLIETLAAGKPVVANNEIVEQELVIKESGGGLCVPYNATAFSQALIKLLSKPSLAREMGADGLKYVNEHNSYARMTIELENLYFRLQRERPTK